MVPTGHIEDGFKLGQWVSVLRRRKDKLKSSQIKQLESLQFVWNLIEHHWQISIEHFEKFVMREGHARVHLDHIENDFKLGNWVDRQRQKLRQNKLHIQKKRQLMDPK